MRQHHPLHHHGALVDFRVFGLGKKAKTPALNLQIIVQRRCRIKGVGRKYIRTQGLHGSLLIGAAHGRERLGAAGLSHHGTIHIHSADVTTDGIGRIHHLTT